jgi:signal transduction histidine kinase
MRERHDAAVRHVENSIRSRLLLWLLGGLLAGGACVLGATYFMTRHQVRELFDEELRQVALAVHVREDWMRPGRITIARPGFELSIRGYDANGRLFFETLMPTLPADLPLTYEEGNREFETSDGAWRIYTHVTSEGIVQVGHPVGIRNAFARSVALRVLAPMLVLVALLMGVIAWSLRQGLAPLNRLSRLVSGRDGSRLDPLPERTLPREVLPLVQQINALLARLASSMSSQGRFLADAAHELRSPVSALALQVQLAERAHTEPARRRAIDELGSATDRVCRLVQQLLDSARLEPGQASGTFTMVDVSKVVREAIAARVAKADERAVDLGADAPAGAYVFGVAEELGSLVANLVDNALRYAPPGTAVTASVAHDEDTVRLCVADSGPGIPAEERERVFERFYRLPGDPTPGSGLGLAIVRSIAEHHGGTVELEDNHPAAPGPGLKATVTLPGVNVKRVIAATASRKNLEDKKSLSLAG